MGTHPFVKLPPFDPQTGELNAIVETPKGSRNKFAFDEKLGLFQLHKILPSGFAFPFDYGFVPTTLADDGDPVDVLVLMDQAAFTGCLVRCRLIGVIEAEQQDKAGAIERNDRLVAVASHSIDYAELQSLKNVRDGLVENLEHFFVAYHDLDGKQYRILNYAGPKRAAELVEAAHRTALAKDKRRANAKRKAATNGRK